MTTWPAPSFDPPESGPFIIGVLGNKPFPEYLDRIAQTKKVQNRQIIVRRWKHPEEIGRCHILYVTNAVPLDIEQAVVRRFASQPVLIVGERPAQSPAEEATIQFLIEQGSVRFVLSAEAAKAHQLQFDARLQRLAKRNEASK